MTVEPGNAAASVETPSGKDADYENFPVGSFLLPKRARPHVGVFYRYARAIDDIADNPNLSATEKIERLSGFEAAIEGKAVDPSAYRTGVLMRESLLSSNVTTEHCLKLIDAFKQDAVQTRYQDWQELIRYCDRSAAPVGRYLIDLTGGSKDHYRSSDALCNALQVINHLQDCKDDFVSMDRVYIPLDWLRDVGADVSMLSGEVTDPKLRKAISRCLDETRLLMDVSRPLPQAVISRRLAMEAAAIINIADRLIVKLYDEDPLKSRIGLSKPGYLTCILRGMLTGFFA